MLRRRHLTICAHRLKSTYLKWPIDESKNRFSQCLKSIENHWKDDLLTKRPVPRKTGKKKYILSMFPYPSGSLHMGHMRVYTLSDVLARFYRLAGFDVIHPIGWDAFGLPAENAARERGIDSRKWTESNIATMKGQLLATGVDFDWDREIRTCSSDYYKWNQWIFLQLYKKGLIRRALSEVNWDPVDGTVLADEQIDSEGRSWRSGALAEKKVLRQWSIETPRFAKRLMDGLQSLAPQWDDVALVQANWIGPCDVYRFLFPIKDIRTGENREELLDLRLQDPRDLASAAFIVVSNDCALADKARKTDDPYILPFEALNGATGAYLPIVVVPPRILNLAPCFLGSRLSHSQADASWTSSFDLPKKPPRAVMSLSLNDVTEMTQFGGFGGYVTSRVQRDWVVSRQRAWGTPIPMALSLDGLKAAPLPVSRLPVLQGVDSGREVQHNELPHNKGIIESDTLDTFFDSSWYFLRYLDPHNNEELVNFAKAKDAMPVDVYVGGIEHAAVHMYYARFMCAFLHDIGVSPVEEPFRDLVPQGIVRAKTFLVKTTGAYVNTSEVDLSGPISFHKPSGEQVEWKFEKMSKSKHNGVDPMETLHKDGIDLTRLQLLYAASPRSVIDWGEFDSRGLSKWLDRLSRLVSLCVISQGNSKSALHEDAVLRDLYNATVRKVTWNLDELQLHRQALCDLMTFTNKFNELKPTVITQSMESERCIKALVIMLQVFAPHAAQELWAALSPNTVVCEQTWPITDSDAHIEFFLKMHGEKFDTTTHQRCDVEQLTGDEALALKFETFASEANFETSHIHALEQLGHKIKVVGTRISHGVFYELIVDVDPEISREAFKELSRKLALKRDELVRKRRKAQKKKSQAA